MGGSLSYRSRLQAYAVCLVAGMIVEVLVSDNKNDFFTINLNLDFNFKSCLFEFNFCITSDLCKSKDTLDLFIYNLRNPKFYKNYWLGVGGLRIRTTKPSSLPPKNILFYKTTLFTFPCRFLTCKSFAHNVELAIDSVQK